MESGLILDCQSMGGDYFGYEFDAGLHQLHRSPLQGFIGRPQLLVFSYKTFNVLSTRDITIYRHAQKKYNPFPQRKTIMRIEFFPCRIMVIFLVAFLHFWNISNGINTDQQQKLQSQKKLMLSYSSKTRPIIDALQKTTSTKENTACNTPDPKRIAFRPTLIEIPKKGTQITPTYDAVLTPKTARTTTNTILASILNGGSYNRSPGLTPDKQQNQQRIKKDFSFVGIKQEQDRVEFRQIENERSRKTSRTVMFQEQPPASSAVREEQGLERLRQTVSNANSWLTKNHLPPKPVKSQAEFQPERTMRKKVESAYVPSPRPTITLPEEPTTPTPVLSPSASGMKFTPRNHTRTRTTLQQQLTPSKKPSQQSQRATPRISQDKLTRSVNLRLGNDPMSKTDPTAFQQRSPLTKRLSSTQTPPRGVSLQDFQLGSCKGQGRFGKVFPARHKKTGFILAIKQIKKQSVRLMLEQFIQELKISLFLSHPNVVKFYGFFHDAVNFYILMEYMQEGTLYKVIKTNKKLDQTEAAGKLAEVCQAVRYLHSLSILHRDIKPQNIVISHNVCKLCDLGWAAYSRQRRTTYCGTLDYVCPQILQGESYDNFVDIWAIGVLAFQMLTGKAPFYHISRQETMKSILKCDFGFPQEMSSKAKGFIAKSLHRSQGKRADIEQLVRDQFLDEGMRSLE